MPSEAVEVCACAGGQALGLEDAGLEHALAVQLDEKRLPDASGKLATVDSVE